METRARYTLIGAFMLAVIAASFAFVYWLENQGGFGERTSYRLRFDSSVSGLQSGSAVLFNGIRVGEVTGLGLDPDHPDQVIAAIGVVRACRSAATRSSNRIRRIDGGPRWLSPAAMLASAWRQRPASCRSHRPPGQDSTSLRRERCCESSTTPPTTPTLVIAPSPTPIPSPTCWRDTSTASRPLGGLAYYGGAGQPEHLSTM